jgi:hypothetical protein
VTVGDMHLVQLPAANGHEPGKGQPPDQVVYQLDGGLASSLTRRQVLIDQHSCFLLATNELDAAQLMPQQLLAGDKGQVQAERSFRFLKDPNFLASSLYLKKPERIMALLMVVTVCWLGYAALEYRIRQVLSVHEATFPDHKGKRIQHPTAHWVLQYFVGIHLLCQAVQWPIGLTLTEEHQHLLASLAGLTRSFVMSDIRKNHEGGAECRSYIFNLPLVARKLTQSFRRTHAATSSLAAFDTDSRASGHARAPRRGPDRRCFDKHIQLLADIHRQVPTAKLVEHLQYARVDAFGGISG